MRRSISILLGILAAAGALTGQAWAATPATVTPLSAAGFRDSIGVNTHVGYTDTAYGNWSGVLSALQQLGVTHVRDLLIDNGVSGYMQQWTSNVQAAAAAGIHFDFVMPEPGAQLGSVSDLVSMLAGPLRTAVESVEDPNEYDLVDSSPSWATTLAGYDQGVASAVRSTPALSGLQLIGPSLVNSGSYQALGNQSPYLDEGNIHPYQAGMPSLPFIQQAVANAAAVAGSKKTVVTEFGDSNALNSVGGYPSVSQKAAAIYILRTYLLDYMAGIPRSYAYELVNEHPDPGLTNTENNFGLLNSDLTPKPAYTALKNLLQTVGRPAAPASLMPISLGVSSPASTLRYTLLQTDATHYQLVLWNDVSVWNSVTGQDVTVSPVTATISAPQVTSASQVRPLVSSGASAVTVRSGSMSVSVQADPVVLSLTLSGSGSKTSSGSGRGVTRPAAGVRGGLTRALRRGLRIRVIRRGPRARVVWVRMSAPVRGLVRVQVISASRRRRVRIASATSRIAPARAAIARVRMRPHGAASEPRLLIRVTLTVGGRSARIVRRLASPF